MQDYELFNQVPDESTADIDQLLYQERFAYSLEHYGKITQVILLESEHLGFGNASSFPSQHVGNHISPSIVLFLCLERLPRLR